MNTHTRRTLGNGRQGFEELLRAIKSNDSEKVASLREQWDDIRQHAESLNEDETRDIQKILGEKYRVLALWCSTPPTPEPTDWSNWSDPKLPELPDHIRRERAEYLSLVNRLWESWQYGKIIEEITIAFNDARYEFAAQWLDLASQWFKRSSLETISGIDDIHTRLDVVAGYDAFVDQLLFDQEEQYEVEAEILILGNHDPLVLELPDKQHVDLDTIGKAIEDISGVDSTVAKELAGTLSFSLPAYKNVLPTISIEVGRYGCLLRSTWEDPLSDVF